jgi:rSAM/selenodomain-associated transferase 2
MEQPLTSPAISVIVPAYQEELAIEGLLQNLYDLRADEIIVVDGGSTDRTVEIAERYARVLVTAPCRAIQMNTGAAVAKGDVLLFLHADVRLGPKAFQAILRAMADPSTAGGNFDVRFDSGDTIARVFTIINRWRCRCGIFYGDSGIFCRRRIFDQLGGYRPWPILEDYNFCRRLRNAGKLKLLCEAIWVSDRRWRRGGLWRTLWSWFWIQALHIGGVSPERLAKLYRHVR